MPALRYCGSVTSSYWIAPATAPLHVDHEQVAVVRRLEVAGLRIAPPLPHAGLGADRGERHQVPGFTPRRRSRGP